jgi:hypothetical protein
LNHPLTSPGANVKVPRFDQERPALTIDYAVSDVWTGVAPNHPVLLRNSGTTDARRIAISDLMVDTRARCRFAEVNDLPAGHTVAIDPVWQDQPVGQDHVVQQRAAAWTGTLTGILSKAVVGEVLAGRRPRGHWAVCLEYESAGGRSFLTVCEIRLRRLPLELGVVRLVDIEPEATAGGQGCETRRRP